MQNIMSSKELFLLMIKCLKKGKLSNSNKNLEVDQRVTLVVIALIYLTTKNLEEKSSNGKSIFKYNFIIINIDKNDYFIYIINHFILLFNKNIQFLLKLFYLPK